MAGKAKSCLHDVQAVDDFKRCVKSSRTILALLGAGLSAPSGLPTFRGAGGLWRRYPAMDLATPEAFAADPSLVWAFYTYRRQCALAAQPNRAHLALAGLARHKPGYMALSQNVDGLLERAGHPEPQLKLLHGSLFRIVCSDPCCTYSEANYDPDFIPALVASEKKVDESTDACRSNEMTRTVARGTTQRVDLSDESVRLAKLEPEDLPTCPMCERSLLRPGVVWFGEALPDNVIDSVESFIEKSGRIDMIIVIGTSASVYPAAGYVDKAKKKGARLAVMNTEADLPARGLTEQDWFFQGDASKILPELVSDITGDLFN